MLEDKIALACNVSILQQSELETTDKLNLLALLPCPLKLPLQEAFNRFIQEIYLNESSTLEYLIEGNANNQYSYYSYVEQFDDIDEIPDIVISPGIALRSPFILITP
jgi:hypothetical protein